MDLEVFNTKQGRKIINQYGLTLVLLFGSSASGKTHAHSDIDIVYFSEKQLNLTEESQMLLDLMPLFRSEFIDLVDLRHAPSLLKKQIARNNEVLHQTTFSSQSDFIAQAFREYEETRSLRDALHNYLMKRISLFTQKPLNA